MRLTSSLVLAATAFGSVLGFPTLAAAQQQEQPVIQDQSDAALTFERVFASPSLDGSSPREAKLSPDGRFLTLLRNRAEDRDRYDLWGFDRDTGEWRMLVDSQQIGSGRELSEDEKMQRERSRVSNIKGIITYQWSSDGKAILVPLDGDLYLAGLDGTITRLTNTEEGELNPRLSQTGAHISFVRNRQLWVGPVDGSNAVPVTPAEEDTVRWGEAEFVAQEEMGRMTGFWWSADDKRIAVERFDEKSVGIVTRAAIGATGTKVYDQRYPVAGSANVDVSLYVMDPDGKNRVAVDLGADKDIYLARVDWSPDGSALYVQRQNRAQTVLDMLKVDPATGKSTVLFTETPALPDYWVNLTDNYKFLKDGSLVWWSERDGFGHLYHLANGKWTQLTAGDWVVTKLLGVDEESGRISFAGTRDGVLAQQIYAINLASPNDITRLSDTAFANSASMDTKGRTLLISRSAANQPPQSYIADAQGQRLEWIEENRLDQGHPYAPYLASHTMPEFGTIAAEDGTPLHWKMIRPKMEKGKTYPVFFNHYGGPHAQVVNKAWGGSLQQAVVDKGYIWFEIDNRGSANRGAAFEQPISRAMGSVEVADQKAGAKFLQTLGYVDPAKIALYGWSYGGYMTLKQLQADPGLYAAGISGAPVTRWELYDTHYTERYMGNPQDVKSAYDASNAIDQSARMTDPLLLVHGMADDNVVFENSSELIARLQGANQSFEMMLYPGFTHRVSGAKISPHLWNTIFSFLEKHGVTPPE
ncbi:prolyl oligopeptidase family serine peptidase [Altererythrobacter confluentis]|uniref:Prolyl oligopeptidase family serine peptidase n=1 Tax=Allopontixanthobacter confluentis TaxID=1849021 RepID=A0A6L7GI28_9SPHN|nr:S9 family peptidase [Allopontixanthobacter confluentis]MXP14351.1 prolyl oligopeptidase family serine peptidase [Allopontixanthobacter confluentis]